MKVFNMCKKSNINDILQYIDISSVTDETIKKKLIDSSISLVYTAFDKSAQKEICRLAGSADFIANDQIDSNNQDVNVIACSFNSELILIGYDGKTISFERMLELGGNTAFFNSLPRITKTEYYNLTNL